MSFFAPPSRCLPAGSLTVDRTGISFLRSSEERPLFHVPWGSLVAYHAARTDTRSWQLSVASVTWRFYWFGMTTHTRSLELAQPFARVDDSAPDPHKGNWGSWAWCRALVGSQQRGADNAMNVLVSLDRRVFAWMREQHGSTLPSVPTGVSLLLPESGLTGAVSAMTPEPPSSRSAADDDAGEALASFSARTTGVSRESPGASLFCDEEALNVAGLVSEAQWAMYGPRFVGAWTVWSLGTTLLSTSVRELPALLVITPLALTLCLPTMNFFTPFPIAAVSGWGANDHSFNFKAQAVSDVYNVVTFTCLVPSMALDAVEKTVALIMAGTQPASPLPTVYPKPRSDEN